jgi:hypothetical protein
MHCDRLLGVVGWRRGKGRENGRGQQVEGSPCSFEGFQSTAASFPSHTQGEEGGGTGCRLWAGLGTSVPAEVPAGGTLQGPGSLVQPAQHDAKPKRHDHSTLAQPPSHWGPLHYCAPPHWPFAAGRCPGPLHPPAELPSDWPRQRQVQQQVQNHSPSCSQNVPFGHTTDPPVRKCPASISW